MQPSLRLLCISALLCTCLLSTPAFAAAPTALPAPTNTTTPGCFSTEACGATGVKVSAALEPRYINGETVPVFACECTTGKKVVVTNAGQFLLDLSGTPTAAPTAAPTPAPVAAAPKPVVAPKPAAAPGPAAEGSGWASADAYRSFYSELTAQDGYRNCQNFDDDLLWKKGSRDQCLEQVSIGKVCKPYCQALMQALGEPCWTEVFVKAYKLDPVYQNSTSAIQYAQCTNGVAYTTKDKYKPISKGPAPAPINKSPAPAPAPDAKPADAAAPTSNVVAIAAIVVFGLLI